jgi:hypothetical protein
MSKKLETIQMVFNERMLNNHGIFIPRNNTQLSTECTVNTQKKLDVSPGNYAEYKQIISKVDIPYDFILEMIKS